MTTESAGHSYSAAVTDDRPLAAVDQAEGERAADVGWEPADWAAVLRRHRRRQAAVALLCLLLVGRAVRRARLARRWLPDPLPRDA
jgi:hypothetical protein